VIFASSAAINFMSAYEFGHMAPSSSFALPLKPSVSRASGRGGGCTLRAPGEPVDLDRYPVLGGSRFHQVERCVRAGVGEQPRALADDHRAGEQGHLVDEVVVSSSHRNRAPQPCTCSSPPGLAFRSAMAVATSPDRTVVFAQRGSVSVVDAT
jgi:hypothetical protein